MSATHPVLSWLRYAPLQPLIGLANVMPWRMRLAFGSALMRAVVLVVPKYRQRVDSNLRLVMPDLQPGDRRRIRAAMADNFGRTILEILDNGTFHARADWIAPEGPAADAVLAAARAGRNVVLVTGHFGQWEALRGWLRTEGITCGGLYRAIGNTHLNEVYERNIAIGGPIFTKDRSGVRGMVRHLARGGILAIGADQYEKRGARLDFLGQEAPTTLVPAEMARKFDAPLVPFYGLREPNGHTIRILVEAEIPRASPEAMMQAANDSLAARIRTSPGQYYWLHRRWTKDLTR